MNVFLDEPLPLVPMPFEDALRKGLGRAAQFVRELPQQVVRENLLPACLESWVYDAQCEPARVPWLFRLIELSGEPEFYRKPILEALEITPKSVEAVNWSWWDGYQLVELAVHFAKQGDAEARDAVYRKYDMAMQIDGWGYNDMLIEMDGMPGLLCTLEKQADGLCDEENETAKVDSHDCLVYLTTLEENMGKEQARAAVQKEAEVNPLVQTFLERALSKEKSYDVPERDDAYYEAAAERRRCEFREQSPFYEMVSLIPEIAQKEVKETDNWFIALSPSMRYGGLGLYAEPDELEHVFDKFMKTDHPKEQFVYLRIFGRVPLPRIESKVLSLLASANHNMRFVATQALSNSSDNQIREKAFAMLTTRPRVADWHFGFDLLEKNCTAEDIPLLEHIISEGGFRDDYILHSVGISLRTIIENQPHPDWKNILLWLYEVDPCSYCRNNFVDQLVENGVASRILLEECLEDASEDTRDTAQKALAEGKFVS